MFRAFLCAVAAMILSSTQAVAEQSALITSITTPFRLSYFGSVYNRDPGFGGAKLLPAQSVKSAAQVALWSLLTLGFQISDDIQLEVQPQWTVRLNQENRFQLGNPRVGVSWVRMRGGWTYLGDANIEFPITDASEQYGVQASPGSYQVVSYQVPKSVLTVGAHSWFRFYPRSIPGRWVNFYGSVGPFAEYTFSPTLAANVIYWFSFQHLQGRDFTSIDNAGSELQPGMSWNMTRVLTLRPFMGIRLSSASSNSEGVLERLSGGMWVTGRIL